MPHESDNPDHPSTLPQPDLNPLLNPILAKNIGRWAEVYFTSAPENRERAVQELVRELERENIISGGTVAPQPAPRQRDLEAEHVSASATAEVPAQGLTCSSCGYVNRARHKFCGRCGMRISLLSVDAREEQEPQAELPVSQGQESPESPVFGFQSTPRWQSYRVFAGVALALVVLILGYMAWRSAQTTSGASQAAPQAPPAVTNTEAPTPPPSSPKADTSSRMPSTANRAENPPSGTTATAPATTPAKTNPAKASPPVTAPPSGENATETPAISAGGLEELATARDFLNGTNGKEQSRTQAVPLLWKAVSKQNAAAAVLLSGMYLRGDGVPRNCEQARLLLDAAAIKGRKDAAELLRNLQAFGCE